jgi:hypothetical protein
MVRMHTFTSVASYDLMIIEAKYPIIERSTMPKYVDKIVRFGNEHQSLLSRIMYICSIIAAIMAAIVYLCAVK